MVPPKAGSVFGFTFYHSAQPLPVPICWREIVTPAKVIVSYPVFPDGPRVDKQVFSLCAAAFAPAVIGVVTWRAEWSSRPFA
jgi:hypothetical protein